MAGPSCSRCHVLCWTLLCSRFLALLLSPSPLPSLHTNLHCRQSIKLSNPSKLPAKYDLVPQDRDSMGLATYEVEPSSGGVPAMGEQVCACARCWDSSSRGSRFRPPSALPSAPLALRAPAASLTAVQSDCFPVQNDLTASTRRGSCHAGTSFQEPPSPSPPLGTTLAGH